MSKEEKKFEVSFSLTVQEIKESTPTPFFDSEVRYHEIPYSGVIMVEQAMLDLLNQLGEAGLQQGDGELHAKLKELGIGPKNPYKT